MGSSSDSNSILLRFELLLVRWLKKVIFRDDLKRYIEAPVDFLRFLAFILKIKSITFFLFIWRNKSSCANSKRPCKFTPQWEVQGGCCFSMVVRLACRTFPRLCFVRHCNEKSINHLHETHWFDQTTVIQPAQHPRLRFLWLENLD